jgi:hypothetical protein
MTLEQIPELVIYAVLAAGSFKAVLNGTVKRVERIETKLDEALGPEGKLVEHEQRISHLEGRRR